MSKENKRYPNIKLGFGFHFTQTPHFHSIFRRWFWHDLRYEIKWAWQRALRGYDDAAIWDMDGHIQKFLVRGLLELADNHHSVPGFEEWADMSLEERDTLWTRRLIEIAGHFYESCNWEESEHEKNEFEDDWYNSHDTRFEDLNDGSGCSRMIDIPKNDYTQEQVDELRENWLRRAHEIDGYKHEQLELGMKKLTAIFKYLWD